MLVAKILMVILALGIIWAVWKVLRAKKVNEKVMENFSPPSEPETTAPAGVSFIVTFSEDLLTAMEHLRITTGARDFKELVYSALVHYDGIVRFKTKGNRIFAQHETTGKVIELNSEQLRAASYIKTPKA